MDETPTSPATLGRAFRTEWIDAAQGIRVGNIEPHERITQILKSWLQARHAQPFVIDKWGRGAYWKWICWVPRKNREAKPISGSGNWCSAKFYISAFGRSEQFSCGMQVERGPTAGPARFPGCLLQDDWDWHRLMRQLRKGSKLDTQMAQLLRKDGFEAWIGDTTFTGKNYKSAGQLKRTLRKVADNEWAGFQLYYPMAYDEVHKMTGPEFVEAVCAVFRELTEAMDCVLEVPIGGEKRSDADAGTRKEKGGPSSP